uniref:MARVEL domain-containing protein n=1 Tax=Cercocebus atys TaxID=9531 RepID=A0A2K5P2R0_CERAT
IGAYCVAKAGGSFHLWRFLTQPQVAARALCRIFALIVFSCIYGENYSKSKQMYCVFNHNEDACRYGSAIGVLAFEASAFLVADAYFPQISNATDRKYLVIGDLLFSWVATQPEDVPLGANSTRTAITFSFFSIFSWGVLVFLAYRRCKAGVEDFIQNDIDSTPDLNTAYASYPGASVDNYQQLPFTQNAETTEGYQPPLCTE